MSVTTLAFADHFARSNVQCLNLRFFIHAKHDGMFGRIEIQAHNVTHFLNQLRIGRQFEGLAAMRLKTETVPDAHYRALTEAHFGSQGTRTPVRSRARKAF